MMDFMLKGNETTSFRVSGHPLARGENDNIDDTGLHLDFKSKERGKKATLGDYLQNSGDNLTQDNSCMLILGLGPTPTSYCADHQVEDDGTHVSPNMFSHILVSGADSRMLSLELSSGNAQPVLARSQDDCYIESTLESNNSTKNSSGYIPSLFFAPRPEKLVFNSEKLETHELVDLGNVANIFTDHNHHVNSSLEPSTPSTGTDSVGAISDAMIVSSGDQRINNHQHYPKKCRFKGCSKGARGASGLCIAHGGGQRCQKSGCNKGAESRTAYCKAHGGGKRCQQLGCTKSAEGKTDYCIAHGGGRRCGYMDCTKAARGKSGLCIRHGGGKRCTVEGCARSAEGQAGLCISHGGGRRCQYTGCNKGAQGSTMHCKAHGGGKRCIFEGCTKGAEGSTPLCKGHGGGKRCLFESGGACPKSVHGGTDYCVAHGGGKRCAVPGCTKSARGRTDCCVRHGGGKRCQVEGCGKSAQGSTDYCKAHGGGKRCSWGHGCEKFARGKSGLCAAHGTMMLSQQDSDGRFVSAGTTTVGSSMENGGSSYGDSAISDCAESSGNTGRMQLRLPSVQTRGEGRQELCYGFVIPEGRVHGGGLMSLLGGSFDSERI